jgi:hypothetical protein
MEPNQENSRNWLTELAEIADKIENTFISKYTKIVIELPEEKFKKLQKNFREIDSVNEEMIISISNIDFTFVLKK